MRGYCSEGTAGKERGKARPPCCGASAAALSKAVEVPAGFPECSRGRLHGRREKERLCWAVQKSVRAGGSVHQSGLPGIDRGWGRWRVAKDSGVRLCALRVAPDKADAEEKRPLRILVRLTRARGRLWGNALCSGAFVPCLPPTGARHLRRAFRSVGRAAAEWGLSEKRSLNKKRGGHGAEREHGAGLGGKQVFRLRSRSLLRFVIRSAAVGDTQGVPKETERTGVAARKTAGARRAEGSADCSGRMPSRAPCSLMAARGKAMTQEPRKTQRRAFFSTASA